MQSIGPTPPHLQKRKLSEDNDTSSSDSDMGPQLPKSPGSDSKRRKVMGPAMPPAPLDERPRESPRSVHSGSSSSDDEYGPVLPQDAPSQADVAADRLLPTENEEEESHQPKRDSWMLAPPSQNDLTARMDPSKLRARKFNSGKGVRGGGAGSGEIDQIWTETPDQKAKRLKDEMMGISKAPSGAQNAAVATKKEDQETARRIREHTERNRGRSLYDQHQKSSKVEDDDPSKRKFDYAKDVGGGTRLGSAQKKEMLNRAKDFGTKFSGGSYL